MTKRKTGERHKGWKSSARKALKKIAYGPLRTATAFREVAITALEAERGELDKFKAAIVAASSVSRPLSGGGA